MITDNDIDEMIKKTLEKVKSNDKLLGEILDLRIKMNKIINKSVVKK